MSSSLPEGASTPNCTVFNSLQRPCLRLPVETRHISQRHPFNVLLDSSLPCTTALGCFRMPPCHSCHGSRSRAAIDETRREELPPCKSQPPPFDYVRARGR